MIQARVIVPGSATGQVLAAGEPLSFWGGYDQHTGEIIDRRHPLSGRIAAGTVLVLPGSRGSSTTSAVLLEAATLGTAPAAIITTGGDQFVALAAVVAAEMFEVTLPILSVEPADLPRLPTGVVVTIGADGLIQFR